MEKFDHKCIHKDIEYFKTTPATGENITVYIWNELSKKLPNNILYKVKVLETPNNSTVYKGEDGMKTSK